MSDRPNEEKVATVVGKLLGNNSVNDVDGEVLSEILAMIARRLNNMADQVREQLKQNKKHHLVIEHNQYRDIQPLSRICGPPEGWIQCGPLVTEITILDYSNAGKDITKEEP